jgi:hypothetical protein
MPSTFHTAPPSALSRLVIFAVLTGLGACTTPRGELDKLSAGMRLAQEPDASAPHALMRISTTGLVMLTPGSACNAPGSERAGVAVNASQILIRARGLGGQRRGVAGEPPARLTSAELRVSAGEPQVLSFQVMFSGYVCSGARSFVPVDGNHYQVTTVIDEQFKRCGLTVMQLLPTAEPVQTANASNCPTR